MVLVITELHGGIKSYVIPDQYAIVCHMIHLHYARRITISYYECSRPNFSHDKHD